MVPIGQGLFRSINIEGRWATQRYHGMWFGRASLLADVPDQWKAVDLASREKQDLPPSYQPLRPPTASDLADGLPRPWKLAAEPRSEEHTSELQSLMRISYAVFCLKKKKQQNI